MPEISSQSFIEQTDLFDSAFVPPLIQLLLSLFSIDRLPELLGFNLGTPIPIQPIGMKY